jgi:hypothetical protein
MNKQLAFLCTCLLFLAAQLAQSQPVIEVAPEMGAAPTNCGILAESMAIDPMIPHAIGTWPIWFAVPNSLGIVDMPTQHYQKNPELEGWWSTKAAWFIDKDYVGEVHIEGFNVEDNSPMYVEFDELTTRSTINPETPGGFVDGLDDWAFFPSYVWVSKAGCYQIHAEWDGGSWEQIIAVGNIE